MFTLRSIVSCSLSGLRRLQTQKRYQPFFLNPYSISDVSACNYQQRFLTSQGLLSSCNDQRGYSKSNTTKMYMAVQNSVQPAGAPAPAPAPVPSGTPSNSWKGWMLGLLLSVVLPIWKDKWGPFLALKNEVDTAVETADLVVDVIEKVAEEVEKVSDEVADQLPEGGKLKGAVCFVERLAKETAKDAHQAEDLIHKVEKVEKEVESFVEPLLGRLNEAAKEAREPK